MLNVNFNFNETFYVIYENEVSEFKIQGVYIREGEGNSSFSGYILDPEAPNEEDAKIHIYDIESSDVFITQDEAEKDLIKRTLDAMKDEWLANETVNKLFKKHFEDSLAFPTIESDKVIYEHD